MATKKAKREAALAKREEFLRKEKERGLAAQAAGRRSEQVEQKQMRSVASRMTFEDRRELGHEQDRILLERCGAKRPDGKPTLKAKKAMKKLHAN